MNSIFEELMLKDRIYKKLIKDMSNILDVSEDAINGYNFNTLLNDKKNKIYNNRLYSFIIFMLFPFFLLLIFFKGLNFKKNYNSDVTFEIWRKDSLFDYYKNIISLIQNKHKIYKYKTYKQKKIDIKIDNNSIIKILFIYFFNLKLLFQIITLNNKYKINLFFLILKLFYAYIKYSGESKYLNTKVIVSALDFGFHILRYELFKKEGIKVILIQSSMRTQNLLQYKAGDIVFVFGESQKKLYLSNRNKFNNIFCVGSIKNENYLNINSEKVYDIMFVEQYYNFDTLPYASNRSYELLLSHLVRFSKENPSFKIMYRTRNEKRKKSLLFTESLKELEKSNIIIDSLDSSYEKIVKSNIVIGYSSALCFEALGLNTKVLFYYYDDYIFELFDYDKSETDILITDRSYDAFSNGLFNLINNVNCEMYFSKYKNIYMSQDNTISETICRYIKESLI